MCTVVISSKEVAREMFKNHDVALAGRKIYEAMKEDASACRTNAIVIGRFLFLMAFNLIGNVLFSKDLLDPKSEKGANFFYHTGKVMEFAVKPNVADCLPILRRLDPQGIRRKIEFHIEKAFEIAGKFIKESMESMEKGYNEGKIKDFLDVQLEFRGDGIEEPAWMRPAIPLASCALPLALGSLLHSFDCVLADGLKPENMDMTERMGITLKKFVPLKVVPLPYMVSSSMAC
ncbi:hypothetical protein CRYUN_Cryun08bG0132100 [Craigia yunnanensis]